MNSYDFSEGPLIRFTMDKALWAEYLNDGEHCKQLQDLLQIKSEKRVGIDRALRQGKTVRLLVRSEQFAWLVTILAQARPMRKWLHYLEPELVYAPPGPILEFDLVYAPVCFDSLKRRK